MSDSVCPICINELAECEFTAHTDGCSHVFCQSCICEWSKEKTLCPVCNTDYALIFWKCPTIEGVEGVINVELELPKKAKDHEKISSENLSALDGSFFYGEVLKLQEIAVRLRRHMDNVKGNNRSLYDQYIRICDELDCLVDVIVSDDVSFDRSSTLVRILDADECLSTLRTRLFSEDRISGADMRHRLKIAHQDGLGSNRKVYTVDDFESAVAEEDFDANVQFFDDEEYDDDSTGELAESYYKKKKIKQPVVSSGPAGSKPANLVIGTPQKCSKPTSPCPHARTSDSCASLACNDGVSPAVTVSSGGRSKAFSRRCKARTSGGDKRRPGVSRTPSASSAPTPILEAKEGRMNVLCLESEKGDFQLDDYHIERD